MYGKHSKEIQMPVHNRIITVKKFNPIYERISYQNIANLSHSTLEGDCVND